LLDDPTATRSGLKSALRRAEAAGVDRVESGAELLSRAKERLNTKAQGAKEAKEKKDAEDKVTIYIYICTHIYVYIHIHTMYI